ncbi:MAG: alanine--tRNA ligase [Methermicoccaceae archaeon]
MDEEYQLSYFREHGFERKQCVKCKKYFWTRDPDRETCGDAPCDTYSFIGSPTIPNKYGVPEMREKFLSFFEKHNHERVSRYPVVARWRDDIYLTIASIADFQPFVTSGLVPPPANPLTISQPCIRLDDLDSVGMSGRHLTLFEMMAHHAFNSPTNEVYWKNETVALCDDLLKELGVKSSSVTYKEEPWVGGGNAGPCLEVLVGGLEVATLVFMNLEQHPTGNITLKGETYRKMNNYIVDTGYGLERLAWASQGSPTIYEATFPEIIEEVSSLAGIESEGDVLAASARLAGSMDVSGGAELRALRATVAREVGVSTDELERMLVPHEKVNAIADHTRCLAFMLGDLIVPSNVKAGYLARLVIRRTLRMMRELGIDVKIGEIVDMHLSHMNDRNEFPELYEMRDVILDVLEREEQKYAETLRKGSELIKRMLKKEGAKTIDTNELINLYDTNGVPPEVVAEVASGMGVTVEVPSTFYSMVAETHSGETREKVEIKDMEHVQGLGATKKMYYEKPEKFEFSSTAVSSWGSDKQSMDKKEGFVVLDATCFYPEGGGQPADTGELLWSDNGEQKRVEVIDVQSYNGVIVHTVIGELPPEGSDVKGVVDADRRISLMRHHTATHIVNWAAKQVLGRHIWQTGAQKDVDRARLDLSHYKRITDEEMREIERLANQVVMEAKDVVVSWMRRTEAEQQFGFSIYQGGVPPGDYIRIVKVGDDVEACGGTHCANTGNVGVIKLIRNERIQDGVERLEFSAGLAAVDEIQRRDMILSGASDAFSVPIDNLVKTARRFFSEWKEVRKENERLREELARLTSELKSSQIKTIDVKDVATPIKYYADIVEGTKSEELRNMSSEIASKNDAVCVMVGDGGMVAVSVSENLPDVLNAREIMHSLANEYSGGGGGKRTLAQGKLGKMPEKESLEEVVERAINASFS